MPSLIERLNSSIPIPYVFAALVVAALLGPLGFYLANLLQYLDLEKGTASFLSTSLDHYSLSELIGNILVYPGIAFYCAFMVHYMRRRIVQVADQLVSDSPAWEETIRKSFGRITATRPAIAITFLFVILSSPLLAFQISNNQGFSQLYFIIDYPLFFFGTGTFTWMYASSLWGLYKIGTQPLKIKPFTEDKLMGLAGFGRISLTLTAVFLIAVLLALYEFTVFSAAAPIVSTLILSAFLIILGVSMFFLPLTNIHIRMVREREHLRAQNLGELVKFVSRDEEQLSSSSARDLTRILALEYANAEINMIPSWPFDAPMIRSLAGIVFAVVASIAARHIILLLGI